MDETKKWDRFVDRLVGFDEWLLKNKRQFLAKRCKTCEGTGVMYVQNGRDDVSAEVCNCQL